MPLTLCLEKMALEIPLHWQRFRDESDLLGRPVEIPESEDLSGVGADIEFFDDRGIADETDNFYPGLIVKKDGFLAVGGCQTGSGDPYFIQISEGDGGALYRIYHDSVGDDGYSREDAVAVVLRDYREILKFTS